MATFRDLGAYTPDPGLCAPRCVLGIVRAQIRGADLATAPLARALVGYDDTARDHVSTTLRGVITPTPMSMATALLR